MAIILNEAKSSIGGPYVFYTVYATEVENSRTAESVQIKVQVNSHLQYAASSLGRGYPLTGYIKLQNIDYSITLKNSDDSWSGTTVHTVYKTITLTGLDASLTTLSNIKFRVVAKNSSESGTLPSTNCSNLSISIGHYVPSDVSYIMAEANPLLISAFVSDDIIVENLSIKQIEVSYTLHDGATIKNVGIFNRTNQITSESNPFNVDFSQISLVKDTTYPNKIPIVAFATDNLDTRGFSNNNTPDLYDCIAYTPITFNNSTTTAKRVGQTSGQVSIDINGTFFNGVIGNVDQSSYKPTIKYKYWKYGDTEPLTYSNTISSSDISISDNIFSVNSLNIGSTTETDHNYFDPEYSYRIKIYVEDNFTNSESNELQIQVGEAIWTEYKDRVDFKKLSLEGNLVDDVIVEQGGDISTNFYIKYKSGLMVQYGKVKVTVAIQTAMNNVFRTNDVIQHDLVVNFYDTDYVVNLTANPAINSAYIGAKSTNSFTIWAIAYNSTTASTRYVDFIAIGKWK